MNEEITLPMYVVDERGRQLYTIDLLQQVVKLLETLVKSAEKRL